jgi:membrane protease YdiL (CAAX protease family)
MTSISVKPIGIIPSFLLFLLPGIAFYFNINVVAPFLSTVFHENPYVLWMFTGTFLLFGPLFALTFILLKRDGFKLDWRTIKERLRLRRITLRDIMWVVAGMAVCTLASILLIGAVSLVTGSITIEELKEMSPIKVQPLEGRDRYFLLFMPVFYFFNYLGEELMWRGYILPRQEVANYGKYAWVISAFFHWVFHMPFSLKAMLFFIPFLFFMPYIVQKRKNTSLSVLIHFLIGAPTQFFVAVGLFS